ncbi:MAG: CHAT domain-containing protein [Planctomycetes bacterium]|nr:CHAT domain-containing protein [Planctomycetota bacterium]
MPAIGAALLLVLAAGADPRPDSRERFRSLLEDWLAARAAADEGAAATFEPELRALSDLLCTSEGLATPHLLLEAFAALDVEGVRRDLAALARASQAQAELRGGNGEAARALLLPALEEFRALGDDYRAGRALRLLGLIEEREGRLSVAAVRFGEAAAASGRIAARPEEEDALAHVGYCLAMAGAEGFEPALERAASLAEGRGDPAAAASHRLRLARLLLARRDLGRANTQLAEAIDRTASGSRERAELLALLGQARLEEHDYPQADTALLEAERLLLARGESRGLLLGEVRMGLARVALWSRDFGRAEERATAAAEAAGEDSPSLLANSMIMRGRARRARNDLQGARNLFHQAAQVAHVAQDVEREASALLNAEETLLSDPGDGSEELASIDESRLGSLSPRSPAFGALRVTQARLALRAGDFPRAEALAREAIGTAEGILLDAPSGPAADFALSSAWGARAFETAVEAVLAGNPANAEEAFALAERSKARAFLVELDRYGVPLAEGAPPHMRENWNRAHARLADLGTELTAFSDALRTGQLRSGLAAAYAELERATTEVRKEVEDRGQAPRPARAPIVREHLLTGDQLLLEYFVGEEATILFVVSTEGVGVHRLPGRDALAHRIDGFLALLRSAHLVPQARRKLPEVARALKEVLLPGELSGRMRDREVYVVPDGPLFALPFEALPDGEGFLGDSTVFAYGASGGFLLALQTRRLRLERGIVAGAFAEAGSAAWLPHAEEEARAVAAKFPVDRSTVVTGASLQKEWLVSRAPDAGVLHLAAHSTMRPDGRIGLLLAPGPAPRDRILWGDEAARLRARDLVVLSACETGRGPPVQGLGVWGLVYPFVFGGASRVVVSLWPVADDSVPELMGAFYDRLLSGASVPVALAHARRTLPRRGDGADAARYAAFVAYGPF